MTATGPAGTLLALASAGADGAPAETTLRRRPPELLLAAIPNILSAHTSVLNGLALRLIALEGRAENRVAQVERTATPARQWHGTLASVSASSIFTAASAIRVLAAHGVDGNVSLDELCLLMCLLKRAKAETVFEFGTFDGRTTVNLAANCAESGRVFTLDLPREQASCTEFPLVQGDAAYIEKSASGVRYRETPFAGRITQVYGDSAKFDFSPYAGGVDFVFIDASHAYEYVMNDSRVALGLLRNGKGVIAWHDYTPWWGGVVRALEELFTREPRCAGLRHIEGTALAYPVVE